MTKTFSYLDGFHYNEQWTYDNNGFIDLTPVEEGSGIENTGVAEGFVPPTNDPPGEDPEDNPVNPQKFIQFFPTAEGYYDYQKNQYVYQYKDQLGNVRVSFGKNPQSGSLEVLDTNNFYPFGMNHLKPDDPSYFQTGSYKNYKYNGKELQETGMYDYGARFYMPDIGRWGVVDPLSEETIELYSYVNNNPIFYNDPTGMSGEAFLTRYKHNKTGEEVNINDGVDATVIVGGYDFAKAKQFKEVFTNRYLDVSSSSSYEINQQYIDFYYQTRYSNNTIGFLESLIDSGPSKRLMPTSDSDNMILLEVPDFGRKGMAKGLIRSLKNTTKSINLPAWRTVIIDMEHIASGHMRGGARVSTLKTMFPEKMSTKQVENLVREAYKHSTKVKTQGDRVLLRGNGIEMWINTKTKIIETAYPIK